MVPLYGLAFPLIIRSGAYFLLLLFPLQLLACMFAILVREFALEQLGLGVFHCRERLLLILTQYNLGAAPAA